MNDELSEEDKKLIEEIERDKKVHEEFDPLLQQADRLPSFLKGTDGSPEQHVRKAGEDEVDPEEPLDDGFGYTPPDPSTFTA